MRKRSLEIAGQDSERILAAHSKSLEKFKQNLSEKSKSLRIF